MIIQKELGKRILGGFITGFATSTGMGIGQEIYKVYQAIDPLYDARMKLRKAKRKKDFEIMMAQTNLKKEYKHKNRRGKKERKELA